MQTRVSNTVAGAISSLRFSNALTAKEAAAYVSNLQNRLGFVMDDLAARFGLVKRGDRVYFEMPVSRLHRESPHVTGLHRDRELYVVVTTSDAGTVVSAPLTHTAAQSEKALRDTVENGWTDIFTLTDAISLGLADPS